MKRIIIFIICCAVFVIIYISIGLINTTKPKEYINKDSLKCSVCIISNSHPAIVYKIYDDWSVDVSLCAIKNDNIKSSDFIYGIYSRRRGEINIKYREQIDILIDSLHSIDENEDFVNYDTNISELIVLIKGKMYRARGYDSIDNSNQPYEEYVKKLSDAIIKAAPSTERMSTHKFELVQ